MWKILHLTEYFYTGTAHGARNNYHVCTHSLFSLSRFRGEGSRKFGKKLPILRYNLSTYVSISTYTGDFAAAFEQSKAQVPAVKGPPDELGRAGLGCR